MSSIIIRKITKENESEKLVHMNIFFGGTFIKKENLEEAGIVNPIKLEYYKIINEVEFINKDNAKYGIKIVKTEYIKDDIKTENKEIKHLSDNEEKTNQILEVLKRNEVTPIGVQDIMQDLLQDQKYF